MKRDVLARGPKGTRQLRITVRSILLLPIWVLQLGTSAKSFIDNPLLGSARLNRMGLHLARVRIADALCRFRRRRLARHVRPDWREQFDRQGYVAISDLMPESEFHALRAAILDHEAPARETVQGDAVTRRIAVGPAMLKAVPALRALLSRPDLRSLFHYVASFRTEPLHYIQTIVTHCRPAGARNDPQEALHADAFHSSLKAWFFLKDVAPDEAPFTYVPGSHAFTGKRLAWEYERSCRPVPSMDRLTGRGSPRAGPRDLEAMGLPQPLGLAVPANTLVVADTVGFHARGASSRPVERVELWSYARRNPFLPWLGGDLLSLPGIAERRVSAMWSLRDGLSRFIGQPWRKVGLRKPVG